MKMNVSLRQWQLSLKSSLDQWRLLGLEQLVLSLVLSLNQLILRKCQLLQLSWPGLPDVWQLPANFSLSLLAHGDEAGKEEKGEGETDLEKKGGNGGHLEHQWCS